MLKHRSVIEIQYKNEIEHVTFNFQFLDEAKIFFIRSVFNKKFAIQITSNLKNKFLFKTFRS